MSNLPEDILLKRKDLWILLGAVALVAVLLAAGSLLPKVTAKQAGGQLAGAADTASDVKSEEYTPLQTSLPVETIAAQTADTLTQTQTPAADLSEKIKESPVSAQPGAKDPAALIPADAYLSVQIGQRGYDPIPLLEDNELSLKQSDGKLNVVGFSKTSIWMKSSTCDNQACVQQGVVTLDNMSTRVLQNMVICLPHEVVLSLLTPQEAQIEWDSLYDAEQTK